MDRVEYLDYIEKIKAAYAEDNMMEVASLASDLGLSKIKESRILEMAADAYISLGEYAQARDALRISFERHSRSRQLAFRLAELSIALDDLDEAVNYYETFCAIAPNDANRFILKYEIGRAGGVAPEELVGLLEAYTAQEKDDRWELELAKIYHELGRGEDCVRVCDDIYIWFGSGEYVKQALQYKNMYTALTPEQQARYEQMMIASIHDISEEEVKQYQEGNPEEISGENPGEAAGEISEETAPDMIEEPSENSTEEAEAEDNVEGAGEDPGEMPKENPSPAIYDEKRDVLADTRVISARDIIAEIEEVEELSNIRADLVRRERTDEAVSKEAEEIGDKVSEASDISQVKSGAFISIDKLRRLLIPGKKADAEEVREAEPEAAEAPEEAGTNAAEEAAFGEAEGTLRNQKPAAEESIEEKIIEEKTIEELPSAEDPGYSLDSTIESVMGVYGIASAAEEASEPTEIPENEPAEEEAKIEEAAVAAAINEPAAEDMEEDMEEEAAAAEAPAEAPEKEPAPKEAAESAPAEEELNADAPAVPARNASALKLSVSGFKMSELAALVKKPALEKKAFAAAGAAKAGPKLTENADVSNIPMASDEDGQLGINLELLAAGDRAIDGQLTIDQAFREYARKIEDHKSEVSEIEAERLKQIQDAVNESVVPKRMYDLDDDGIADIIDEAEIKDVSAGDVEWNSVAMGRLVSDPLEAARMESRMESQLAVTAAAVSVTLDSEAEKQSLSRPETPEYEVEGVIAARAGAVTEAFEGPVIKEPEEKSPEDTRTFPVPVEAAVETAAVEPASVQDETGTAADEPAAVPEETEAAAEEQAAAQAEPEITPAQEENTGAEEKIEESAEIEETPTPREELSDAEKAIAAFELGSVVLASSEAADEQIPDFEEFEDELSGFTGGFAWDEGVTKDAGEAAEDTAEKTAGEAAGEAEAELEDSRSKEPEAEALNNEPSIEETGIISSAAIEALIAAEENKAEQQAEAEAEAVEEAAGEEAEAETAESAETEAETGAWPEAEPEGDAPDEEAGGEAEPEAEEIGEAVTEEAAGEEIFGESDESDYAEYDNEEERPAERTARIGNRRYIMPDSLREEISEFLLIDGMEEQIIHAIDSILVRKRAGDVTGGNLIITGDAKSGKTFLAIAIIKAVCGELGEGGERVAKVQAEALCGKNIAKVFSKIGSADLVIENVGYLDDETIEDLIANIKAGNAGGLVVLEGNRLAVENIIATFPEIEGIFNTFVEIDELGIQGWGNIAREYAESRGYKIDDIALLALHAKINEINLPTVRLGMDDIREIVDKAIVKAEKRNVGKLFSSFKKTGSELKDLSEADFS